MVGGSLLLAAGWQNVLECSTIDLWMACHSKTCEPPSVLVHNKLPAWQNIVSMCYIHVGNGVHLVWTDSGSPPVLAEINTRSLLLHPSPDTWARVRQG